MSCFCWLDVEEVDDEDVDDGAVEVVFVLFDDLGVVGVYAVVVGCQVVVGCVLDGNFLLDRLLELAPGC